MSAPALIKPACNAIDAIPSVGSIKPINAPPAAPQRALDAISVALPQFNQALIPPLTPPTMAPTIAPIANFPSGSKASIGQLSTYLYWFNAPFLPIGSLLSHLAKSAS